MAKLTEADVAAISHARTITCLTRGDGTGAIRCEGPGVARDVFGSALAFYGHRGEPVHCVVTESRQDGAPGAKAHVVEHADTDPGWRTVAASLQPGEQLLLYWSPVANGTLLRLVVADADAKTTRTYLVACVPHEPSVVVTDPTPTVATEPEPKPAEPKARPGIPAAEPLPLAAAVRRMAASTSVEHRAVTTVVLVALGVTFAVLSGLPVVHTVVAFLVLGGGTLWSRRRRSAPRAGAAAPRTVSSLPGRRAA